MAALTHEFAETLNAPREQVFRALTDEAELTRWFAEHVHVEPYAGGAYRFWGMRTYSAPSRTQASQKILRIEAPSLLVFSWTLEERESEVTLELSAGPDDADGATTLLKGRHHFPLAPEVPRASDLIEDLWTMTLANLRAHLAGGGNICLPDFSDPIARLRQTILINAPRDKVFQSLLGARGDTRILEQVEDTKLVVDWPGPRPHPNRPPQRVTWVLDSVGEHTRVILIHEPFERTTDLSDHPQRWIQFLGGLKTRMEA
jgi:uncharacterized protein YndB with AHSA1/START domain